MGKEELKTLIGLLKRFRSNSSDFDTSKDFLVPSYELQNIDDTIGVLEEQFNIEADL